MHRRVDANDWPCDIKPLQLVEWVILMKEKEELWKQLCAQAAVEQDAQKLLELTRRINELLLGKQRRLEQEHPPKKP